MMKFELVIAGGGLAAARAIKSYRESGGRGLIALLSSDRGAGAGGRARARAGRRRSQ